MNRLASFSLILSFLLTLTACGKNLPDTKEPEEPPQEDGGEEVTIYHSGGVEMALPNRYAGQLTVYTSEGEAENGFQTLFSVYETASLRAAETDFGDSTGFGFLFGFAALDQAALEQYLSALPPNAAIFAQDETRYYAYTYPTDVQFYRSGGAVDTQSEDWQNWQVLNGLSSEVQADLTGRNGLRPFTMDAFFEQEFTYGGDHVYLNYYPNFASAGNDQEYYTLVLSQPVRQGHGGIWCVERMLDASGQVYYYFPDSGKPAMEYYEGLQEACGAGRYKELLTPLGAAKFFVQESGYFSGETSDESFRALPDAAS